MLAQTSIDLEAWLREDLGIAHAVALDAAAINGSGISNQPTGLLQTPGVGLVVGGTNGAMITYAFMASLQDSVISLNGNIKNSGLGYLASPAIRNKLLRVGILDQAGAGVAVWSGDMAAGWPAQASTNVPSTLTKGSAIGVANAIVFGYWPSLIIGEWGVMELVVDPYKLKKQGLIEVTSFMLADILVAQPASFAVMKDALVA
jgi:HK97 family phage major capsid protein